MQLDSGPMQLSLANDGLLALSGMDFIQPSGLEQQMQQLQRSNLLYERVVVRCNLALLARYLRQRPYIDSKVKRSLLQVQMRQWRRVKECNQLQRCRKIRQQAEQSLNRLQTEIEESQSINFAEAVRILWDYFLSERFDLKLKSLMGCLEFGLLEEGGVRRMALDSFHPFRQSTHIEVLNHPYGIQKIHSVVQWADHTWLERQLGIIENSINQGIKNLPQ